MRKPFLNGYCDSCHLQIQGKPQTGLGRGLRTARDNGKKKRKEEMTFEQFLSHAYCSGDLNGSSFNILFGCNAYFAISCFDQSINQTLSI